MKFKLIIILIIFSVIGCISNNIQSLTIPDIIEKNTEIYLSATNSQMTNISAMLRQYNMYTNTTILLIISNKNQYIDNLTTNLIAINYPIKATDEEIKIFNNFLNDIIKIIKQENILNKEQYISDVSSRYILNINKKIYNKWENGE